MKTWKRILTSILCLTLAAGFVACGAGESSQEQPVSGGWSTGAPTEPDDAQKAVFAKAVENLDGVSYTPVLYLGFQVVAGYNHRFLCKAQVIYPDAQESWVIVEIYEDLEGNAEITNVIELTAEQAAQYGA